MPNKSVVVELRAQVANYLAGFRQAGTATKQFASDSAQHIAKHQAEIDRLALGAGVLGAAVVLGVGKAIRSYADFDKQMSVVAAQGAEAKASLDELRSAAVKAGADTMFSAGEAAQGITALMKAGVAASNVIHGGLAGALDLAAAGGMDVASAAEDMATALSQFEMDGSQASHVADLLAAGANKAQGDVSDMAMALAQGGLVAKQTGLTIEETTGALTAFASAGLLGSDAGTSLKTMLQRLTPQSAEAQKQFDKLGISAYDSQGNFVGLAKFAGQLKDKLSGYSPEARNAALATMFGSDAVRAASVLYEEGADGIQKWIDAINEQGFAQRQAAEMTNNLSGDLERLSGSIDTVFIQSGSGANDVLRQMTQGAEAFVDQIGQIPAPVLSALTSLVGAGGLATLGVAGLMKLSSAVVQARLDMKALGITTKTAGLAATGVGVAIAIASLALASWAQNAAEAQASTATLSSTLVVVGDEVKRTDATVSSLIDTLTTDPWTSSMLGVGAETATQRAKELGISVDDMTGYILGSGEAYDRVKAKLDAKDNAWAWVFGTGADPAAAAARTNASELRKQLDGLSNNLTDAERATLDKAHADQSAALNSSTYSEALTKANALGEHGTEVLKEYSQQQFEAANAALKASGLEIGWQAALDDTTAAIKKNGKAARTASGDLDLNTAKGRANQQALDQLAAASLARVQSMEEEGAGEDEIRAKMERTRKQFIANAIKAGMAGTAANKLADTYGLIPDRVATRFSIEFEAYLAGIGNGAGGQQQSRRREKYGKADGGLLEQFMGVLVDRFASGGTWGQPQVRPFQGADGVQWGEQGSGPWEAFISGAPQKRDRSIAVWREVGRRLLGDFSAADMVAGLSSESGAYADGGIKEPTHKGRPLSWWQDYLKSDLELTQMRIQIRDLRKQLNAKGKDRLKGLDRTAARQELAQDQRELSLAMEARKLNRSKAGTIARRLSAWEVANEKAASAKDAAKQKAEDASNYSDQWMSKYLEGSTAADLLDNLKKGASEIASYNDALGSLGKQGLKDPVLQWLWSQGPSASLIAKEVLAGGKSSIDMLNVASGNLVKAADAAGQSQATGSWVKSPAVPTYTAPPVEVPGYMASGSVPAAHAPGLPGKTVKFYVTQDDPYAASIVINQQLKNL